MANGIIEKKISTTYEALIINQENGETLLSITRSGKMRIIDFDFSIFPSGEITEITLAQSDRPLRTVRAPVMLFDGSAKVFAFVSPNGTMGFYNSNTRTASRGVGELVYAVE